MLTKHQVTHVLSLDFKTKYVYLSGIGVFNGPPLLTLKFWRELDRGENDIKDSLV